ncbi:hypothetical protein [Dyella telluris]|uniref:Uncharacterized protein n=1 Tax=Dyella telluris TaxID=2763498 RepID=A0A7G8Q4J6_9GAMM|nr:hypothetical protein [Dyella telluris]QNK01704.1 hypothetical protein H8F01_00545 [Dyella telluris]
MDGQSLYDEFKAWCEEQGLPWVSADELLWLDYLTSEQRDWLENFVMRWDEAGPQKQWGEQ